VVVDSGSTDGSAETAEALGARLVRLAPEDFSHSHARNLGAEQASGDYVLFTVQDALPPSDGWLHEMFSGLGRHAVAAVTCGEQPRADADLFYRAISWNHARFMSAAGGDTVMARGGQDDPLSRRRNGQLSDTACLIARGLFLEYRHRGNYAEDLDLGLRLVADGYRLAFLGSTRIIHSHNRPAYYHLRRSYVEHLALFDMLPGYPSAPGDGGEATRDIVRSCAALDGLVRDGLPAFAAPGAAPDLRAAVTSGLRAGERPQPEGAPAGTDYLDDRTRDLVQRLRRQPLAGEGHADPAPSPLVEGGVAMAGTICDYLEHTSQELDLELLEAFKAALYKGWALHCGVRLASAYWRGPGKGREALRTLHDELTSGV